MVKVKMISVVIIVKNDTGIDKTLSAIQTQSVSVPLEVVVVDASSPQVLDYIRRKYPTVIWDAFDQKGKRFTIPEQRNRGLELAKGDLVVFIDASCVPVDNWLSSLRNTIESGEYVVCGPCRPSNPKNLVHYIEEHSAKAYVSECTTINVAVRRVIIDRVGQFDTNLTYGEDVDYFWRVKDAGYKLCYDPNAGVTHDYGDMEEQRRRAFRYGKSRIILYKKHWHSRWAQLLRHEPHVWMYPLFLVTIPLAIWSPLYLCVLAIPIIKNRSIGVVLHHFIYATGVIAGVFSRS